MKTGHEIRESAVKLSLAAMLIQTAISLISEEQRDLSQTRDTQNHADKLRNYILASLSTATFINTDWFNSNPTLENIIRSLIESADEVDFRDGVISAEDPAPDLTGLDIHELPVIDKKKWFSAIAEIEAFNQKKLTAMLEFLEKEE